MSRVVAETPAARRIFSQVLGSDLWIKRKDIIQGRWEPEVKASGTMTVAITSVEPSEYIYIPLLEVCFISVNIRVTTGGVASTTISFSMPRPAKYGNTPLAVQVLDTSALAGHCSTDSAEGLWASVNKYDNANFGIGTGRVIRVSGLYLTA